jgi:hypothetical protein
MRSRHGFTTLAALGLLGIIGATLATLAVAFSRDVKRSVRQTDDAQLRQLLIAGESAVETAIRAGGVQNGEVPLPAELTAMGMSAQFARIGESSTDSVHVRVTAKSADGRSARQILRFVRAADAWKLSSAELD